jgi:hypothetical protein
LDRLYLLPKEERTMIDTLGKERQLRQVVEDYDRCHPADAQCAERQQLKHEACEELDRERLAREEAACVVAPGCGGEDTCKERAKAEHEKRADTCTTAKA